MKTVIILIFLVLVCSSAGRCETWRLYYSNSEYYDVDSIASTGPVRNVWLKSTALGRRALSVAGGAANYSKFAVELDCSARTMTVLGSFFYDSADRLIKKSIPPEGGRRQIPIMASDSYGYETKEQYLFEALCQKASE
jgi:hypothetical protein